MQRQVRFRHLLERRPKRRDQGVRQPVDETDRVRDQQLPAVAQTNPPQQRIKGDEERVGRDCPLLRQPVKEGRLAGIGIADKRDGGHRLFLPPLAKLCAALAHLFDLPLNRLDPGADAPAVGFKLRLTRASGADASAEP